MIAVIIGPPGAGKSSQSELLKDREHVVWVYVGQLLRQQNNPDISRVMSRGDLVDDNLVNGLIAQELAKIDPAKVVVLDGFPRHTPQAAWLIDFAASSAHSLRVIIHLKISAEESLKRLRGRARADDTKESINQRLTDYQANIHPLIDYFSDHGIEVAQIDGERSVERVFADIDKLINHVHQS